MALEGQLSDFSLPEILQLIASQQKSGFLHLEASRDMVFIFDRGVLISTRDRRNASRDPLESFLRAYGFFSEEQWKHIEYIGRNSSLDLTEIVVSEGLLGDKELMQALRSLAQEMVHKGMKLRRGRYHFTPTPESPPGVRGRFELDVQGLLMEAARRLDEEPRLNEALPSQSLTFVQGEKGLDELPLTAAGKRVMKLALAGLPLGRIIRQAKTESFVVRDLLLTWCEEGYLAPNLEGEDSGDGGDDRSGRRRLRFGPALRSVPLVLLLSVALGAVGWLQWYVQRPSLETAADALRQRQLRSEVIEAAELFRYENGHWPESLGVLVRTGQLAPATLAVVEDLGWKYELDSRRDRFSFGS